MKIIKIVHDVNFISGSQLTKTFYANKNDGKKSLKKLTKMGFLTKHELKNASRYLIFYTLGPAGYKAIDEPYKPNWWLNISEKKVLKQLILNQFYLRIFRTNSTSRFLLAPYPLSGIVTLNEIEFPIIVIRDDIEDISRDMTWTDFKKILIIGEDIEELKTLVKNITVPVRFLTDYGLCYISLNNAFYVYDKDKDQLKNITVNIFKENT